MIEEMQSRGLVINNLPPVLPDPAQPSTSSVPQSSGKVAESAPVKPPSEPSSDESSGDYYQRYSLTSAFPESKCGYDFTSIYSGFDHLWVIFVCLFVYFSTGGPMWTTEVRVEMAKKGLYMKHSIDHPLLAGFNNYLHTDLGNKSSKQEVSELNE